MEENPNDRLREKVKIEVTISTREALKRMGQKGETYNDVINSLIDNLSMAQAHIMMLREKAKST